MGIPGEFSTVIAPQHKHILLCWFRIKDTDTARPWSF